MARSRLREVRWQSWRPCLLALALNVAAAGRTVDATALPSPASAIRAAPERHLAKAAKSTPVNRRGTVKRGTKARDAEEKRFWLRRGERVLVLYERDAWYWVKSAKGREGWVKKRHIRLRGDGRRRPGKTPAKVTPAVDQEVVPEAPVRADPGLDDSDRDPDGAPAGETEGDGDLEPETSPPSSVDAPQRVLVLELSAAGVPEALTQQTSAIVAQEIAGRRGLTVVTVEELRDLLSQEEHEQLLGCGSQTFCAAPVGEMANADLIVGGSLGMIGSTLSLALSLIDPEEVAVRGRVSRVVVNGEQLAAEARAAVGELFGWTEASGARFRLPDDIDPSFAVMDLVPSGVEAASVTSLTQILSAELKRVEGARVIGRDDIKAVLDLEADRQLLGCNDDTSCLAEIGAALGVRYLVAGHVGRIAESYLVSLRLIDPESVAVVNRVTESFVGPEGQLVGAVRHTLRRLLGISSAETGVIALTAMEAEAEVFVDGAPRGRLPLQPIGELAPGRHGLRVAKEGFVDWTGDVYIDPGAQTELAVELVARPVAWYQSWIFWTSAAAVTVAGVVGGGVIWALQTEANQAYPFSLEVGVPAR